MTGIERLPEGYWVKPWALVETGEGPTYVSRLCFLNIAYCPMALTQEQVAALGDDKEALTKRIEQEINISKACLIAMLAKEN